MLVFRLIHSHNVASPTFLAVTSLNYIMNTCWVFIADRSFKDNKLIAVASFFLFAIAATNILATGIMAKNIAYLQKSINKSFSYVIIYRLTKSYTNNKLTAISLQDNSQRIRYLHHLDSHCESHQSCPGHWICS